MSTDELHIGIDVGSVSVNLAVIDGRGEVLEEQYLRHQGQPMAVAADAIKWAMEKCGAERITGLAATGSGGRAVAEVLETAFINEVVAQAAATTRLYPQVRTIIEIGGEDSKLIIMNTEVSLTPDAIKSFLKTQQIARI